MEQAGAVRNAPVLRRVRALLDEALDSNEPGTFDSVYARRRDVTSGRPGAAWCVRWCCRYLYSIRSERLLV